MDERNKDDVKKDLVYKIEWKNVIFEDDLIYIIPYWLNEETRNIINHIAEGLMTGVKNRIALVTGAGSENGIGYATANLLRAAGAKVAITSTTERIFQRLEEMDGTAEDTYAKTADLTDTKSVKSLIENVEGALGAIDIVINNAGMVQTGMEAVSYTHLTLPTTPYV